MFDYAILGAGPTGLATASRLHARHASFICLEKEPDTGGLCRSVSTPLGLADIGGGHLWNSKHEEVNALVLGLFDDWVGSERDSTIMIDGMEIPYPFEDHLWAMKNSVPLICDVIRSRMTEGVPSNFREWIMKNFGESAHKYMLPYNEKLWGAPLERMSTAWTHALPALGIERIVESILHKKTDRNKLLYATWKYPQRGGFGRIFGEMARPFMDCIRTNEPVAKVEMRQKSIVINESYEAKTVINTVPWPEWPQACKGLPVDIEQAMLSLEAVPLTVELVAPQSPSAQWTYFPDPAVPYHRKFFSAKWMPGAKFDFTETNSNRFVVQNLGSTRFFSKYAYPIQTFRRDKAMINIRKWAKENRIIPLGRWGLWQYENTDVCMQQALDAMKEIIL